MWPFVIPHFLSTKHTCLSAIRIHTAKKCINAFRYKAFIHITVLFTAALAAYGTKAQPAKNKEKINLLRISLLHFPDSAYIDELVIRYDTVDGIKPVAVETGNTHKPHTIATMQNGKLLNVATYRKARLNDTIPLVIKADKKDIFFIRLQDYTNIKRHIYIKDFGATPLLQDFKANTHYVCHYYPADTLPAEKRFVIVLSDTLIIKRFDKSSGHLEPGALHSVHYDRKSDEIHVKMGIGKFHVTISDQMGNRVFDGPVISKKGLVKIGTAEIKNGLYSIKMVDVYGNYETGKFIKH